MWAVMPLAKLGVADQVQAGREVGIMEVMIKFWAVLRVT